MRSRMLTYIAGLLADVIGMIAIIAAMKIISAVYSFASRCIVAGAVVFAVAGVNVAFAFDWKDPVSWKTVTEEEVRTWIKAGANVGAKNRYGRTPLHMAAGHQENPAIISALLAAGADVGVHSSDGGLTPLHAAAGRNINLAVISVLLAAGADVNATDKRQATPLHWAAWNNKNPAVVSALLNAGADANAKDERGATPLHHAAWRNKNPSIISALIEAGANVGAKDNYGGTPLHYAAWENINPVITALIAHGADLESKDNTGKTPLDQAHEFYNTAIVEYLSDPAQVKRDAEEYRDQLTVDSDS